MTLHISPDLTLPDDAVSHTFALLAMRGAGKSNGLVVMFEAMYDAGLPCVAIDPKGDWTGIRSSRDGTSAGLPVPIFGGLRGDVPLEATAGPYIADLIFEQNLTCLLDVSQFSKGEQARFLAEFGERLYRRHQAEPCPRHVFLEEADEPLPQSFSTRTDGGYIARCVGAWTKIVKLGRSFGLGVTMATQRSASLNKGALSQTESLIVMRTAAPQDRKAIKDWVDTNAASPEILTSMPSLDNGEAWMVSPHVLRVVQRFRFSRRRTFDSGATPKVGQKPVRMTTLAEVDFAAIKDAMSATIEKAKGNDPIELRKRITGLERDLAAAAAHVCPDPAPVEPQIREVPVLDDDVRAELHDAVEAITTASTAARNAVTKISAALERRPALPAGAKEGGTTRPGGTRPSSPAQRPVVGRAGTPNTGEGPRRQQAQPATNADAGPGAMPLKTGAHRMVTVLARMGDRGLTRDQLSTLAQVTKGGTFSSYLSALRLAGLITEDGQRVGLTATGWARAGEVPPPPTTEQIVEMYASKLKTGARRMLDLLVAAHPGGLTKAELSDQAEVTKGGTFSSYLSALRTNGLIDERDGVIFAGSTLYLA